MSAKVVFWYIFRSIFSKEIVNVRVGNKTFEKLGKHQKFWVGGGGGGKNPYLGVWGEKKFREVRASTKSWFEVGG